MPELHDTQHQTRFTPAYGSMIAGLNTVRHTVRQLRRTRALGFARMLWLPALLLLVTAVVAAGFGDAGPVLGQTREQTERALRATVQVIVPTDTLDEVSLGSGTVMDETGLILTNHHVVAGEAPNGLMNSEGYAIIAMTPDDLRGEAVFRYFGTVVKVDPVLDLALIRIDSIFDDPGAPLPGDLGLTAIEWGDSDDLMIADTINIFGYPGIGGNTPTLTRGLVSGFLDDNRDGVFEWIKTDAVLSSGNSGGLATDDQGRFIGVPTAGRVSDTAGQLGLVRTGALALNFVDSYFPTVSTNQPAITRVEYARAVSRRNTAVNPGLRFATGTTDIYAVFHHQNFTEGRQFTAVWRLDDAPLARDEFLWDSEPNGSNWISINAAEGLPDGFLELELLFNNQSVYRGGATIGPGASPSLEQSDTPDGASFGAITFSQGVLADRPVNAGVEFAGLDEIYAFFAYEGMVPGAGWNTRWYLNDTQVLEQFELWDGGSSGNYYVTLSHPSGLPMGNYRLELYIENRPAQSGEFRITARAEQLTRQVGISGTLVDRDNRRRPVHGALVMALVPGTLSQEWLAAGMPGQAVFARGTTNRQGAFRLDTRLTAGEQYAFVVMHDQYRTIAVPGHLIPTDASDPYRLDMEMQRN